jgi:hypothetical protein
MQHQKHGESTVKVGEQGIKEEIQVSRGSKKKSVADFLRARNFFTIT